MQYKVIPLFYAANENFKNTIRFSVEFTEKIDCDSLAYAVEQIQKRYQQDEDYILETNSEPFVISEKNRTVCLNSPESNEHLLAFAFDANILSVDISHFICDGNGIIPSVKTLMYYYILNRYGDSDLDTETIYTVTDTIPEAEYQYPFPDSPLPPEEGETKSQDIENPFIFAADFFEPDGVYAYNFQIRQNDLMKFAKANGGSPVSVTCSMLYSAVMKMFPENKKDVVFEIPHTYRRTLGKNLSHDCLARVFFAKLSPELREADSAVLNASVRKQISDACDRFGDVQAINGLIQLDAHLKTLSLIEKKKTMQGIVSSVLAPHTFGVSYTGRISWGGTEKYIADVRPYAGEMKPGKSPGIEIFTVGDYFSFCVMQPGKNPALVNRLVECFESAGVKCNLRGEEKYILPDYKLP